MTTPATPPPPAPVPPELPEGYHIIPKDWLRTNLLPDDAIFTFSGNPWKPSHLRGFQLQSWEIETGGRFYATRAEPTLKPPEIMFAVYCREPGSDKWFEQETSTDESLVREWRDRNNERSPELYDPPREYILVRKTTTFTRLP